MNFQDKIKIALENIDVESFYFKDCMFGGDECVLVYPKNIGFKWNQKNKYLRSVIYRKADYQPVSLGFPKFVNAGENPDNFPIPTSLEKTTTVDKIDGSLLCVSKYKDDYILRTRGTFDASLMPNSEELNIFKESILPKLHLTNQTYLFEWYSPNNRIVLNYGINPIFTLIGIISHLDYALTKQKELDNIANQVGFLRPRTYYYNKETLNQLTTEVAQWNGQEGICLYSKNDQEIHKIKSLSYLTKHRLKSELGSLEKMLDFYLENDQPDFQDFFNQIKNLVDIETANASIGDISIIIDADKQVKTILSGMSVFVDGIKLLTRKEAALKIISSYGKTNRAEFCFQLLDGKNITKEGLKKLLFQVLKKDKNRDK